MLSNHPSVKNQPTATLKPPGGISVVADQCRLQLLGDEVPLLIYGG